MRNITVKNSNIMLRIYSIYDSMKAAEQRIADYILSNMDETVKLTIEELALRSQTSYATINRFCRKLEYSGYKELKSSLVYYLTNNKNFEEIIQKADIHVNTSISDLSEDIYGLAYKVLDESLALIDIQVIESVVNLMLASNKICFIGRGTSGICAMYGATKCLSIGIPNQYYSDATFYRMAASLLGEGDILFAISSSGRTASIVEAAKIAKKNNAQVISLSDFAISPLAKVSDYNLYTTPRNGGIFLNIDMPLLVGQVTIIDLLYACLCVRSQENATLAYSKIRASVDSEKIK